MTISTEELRRVCALVSEGRADIRESSFRAHDGQWKPTKRGTILAIKIDLAVEDVTEVVCKTLTPQQAYEEAEREFGFAGERLEAAKRALDAAAVAVVTETKP